MNVEKARKMLDHIRRYPEQHDQSMWVGTWDKRTFLNVEGTFACAVDNDDHPPCGTNLCAAGWVSFLEAPAGTRLDNNDYFFRLPDGKFTDMKTFATDQLEISLDQATVLFHICDNADELAAVVNHLEANPDAGAAELSGVIGAVRFAAEHVGEL